MQIIIINGPNLNLLGKREPEIYGRETFEDYFSRLQQRFADISLDYFQSNAEGALIDKLHEVGFSRSGIVLNAGAYSHTSLALADAIKAISSPVVEVHLSNIYAREAFRHRSCLAPYCRGSIVGLGLSGYTLAVTYLRETVS